MSGLIDDHLPKSVDRSGSGTFNTLQLRGRGNGPWYGNECCSTFVATGADSVRLAAVFRRLRLLAKGSASYGVFRSFEHLLEIGSDRS